MITTTAFYGSKPQQNDLGQEPGLRPLYYSNPNNALLKDVTVRRGYGELPAGTVLCRTLSAYGECVPYTPNDHTAAHATRMFAVSDISTGTDVITISEADSFKLAVGDTLVVAYDDTGLKSIDGGLIISIGATGTTRVVTFTNAIPASSDFTVANGVHCYVASTATVVADAKNVMPLFVMDRPVDTGTGTNAVGALVSVVMSNAILMKDMIRDYEASMFTTGLSGFVDRRHFILR